MSQNSNRPSQCPKAFVAILGTAAISTAAYYLKEPNIMWSLLGLIFIIEEFD